MQFQQDLQYNPSLEKTSQFEQPAFLSNQGQQWQGQQAGGFSNIPAAPAWNGWNRGRANQYNSRRLNLRTRNWGSRSENGWSGFNRSTYSPQSLAQWEWKSIILSELRATHGNRSRGINFASAPTIAALPAVAALPAAPATIVPVNMLPAPINDGSKYAKLVGSARRSDKYRRHLKQPLSNSAPLTPLSAGLLANGYSLPATALPASGQRLSRKQRKALKRQQNNSFSNTRLTPLGTSATSGLSGLPAAAPLNNGFAPLNNGFAPLNNGFAPLPASNAGLSRKQKKALRKQNKGLKKQNSSTFFAPNALPAGQPVVNAIPVTNVLASPVLSAAAPFSAPTNTFIKTEMMPVAPIAVGRSAF